MINSDISLSRPIACAAQLAPYAADVHRFSDKRVLLTGDAEILATDNGRFLLFDNIRLLVRFCRFVDVWLPASLGELRREAASLAKQIEFTKPVNFLDDPPNYSSYDAILSVGITGRPDLPWTTINSNGWLARVSSTGTNLDPACSQREV